MDFLRYDTSFLASSSLNPIEDLMNLIASLKSLGYTSDLLKEVHGFQNSKEINKTAKIISLHIGIGLELAEQGLTANPQTSYLPLYYSVLNINKALLLCLGKREALNKNKWHGAQYLEKEMGRDLLNERISLKAGGSIPLLYQSISNKKIGKNGIVLTVGELYSNISSVSIEYNTVTKKHQDYLIHKAEVVRDDENGHFLRIRVPNNFSYEELPGPRTLAAYPNIKKIRGEDGKITYETKRVKEEFSSFHYSLQKKIRRYLISDFNSSQTWYSVTPISGKEHVLNEELSITLAFFHLSNVVRYNPEHLFRISDSKYWPIILGLRKHGYLRFQKLMWGNFLKTSFDIN